ncbi:MAG: hypothetical protein QXO01_00640 [Nitrososphaerota archaeon]
METKYLVKVEQTEKSLKQSKESLELLKGAISKKMLSKMKKERVNCPVVGRYVPFLDCFACVSFIRRVKGEVHCAGIEFRLKSR